MRYFKSITTSTVRAALVLYTTTGGIALAQVNSNQPSDGSRPSPAVASVDQYIELSMAQGDVTEKSVTAPIRIAPCKCDAVVISAPGPDVTKPPAGSQETAQCCKDIVAYRYSVGECWVRAVCEAKAKEQEILANNQCVQCAKIPPTHVDYAKCVKESRKRCDEAHGWAGRCATIYSSFLANMFMTPGYLAAVAACSFIQPIQPGCANRLPNPCNTNP